MKLGLPALLLVGLAALLAAPTALAQRAAKPNERRAVLSTAHVAACARKSAVVRISTRGRAMASISRGRVSRACANLAGDGYTLSLPSRGRWRPWRDASEGPECTDIIRTDQAMIDLATACVYYPGGYSFKILDDTFHRSVGGWYDDPAHDSERGFRGEPLIDPGSASCSKTHVRSPARVDCSVSVHDGSNSGCDDLAVGHFVDIVQQPASIDGVVPCGGSPSTASS